MDNPLLKKCLYNLFVTFFAHATEQVMKLTVQGFHVYQDVAIWIPLVDEGLHCERKDMNVSLVKLLSSIFYLRIFLTMLVVLVKVCIQDHHNLVSA